jgi:hypothetical protein
MSADFEAALRLAQDGPSTAAVRAASEVFDASVHKAAPFCSDPSAVVPSALEEQNRQLIAQVQRMQERIHQLEQQVEELTARPPSAGTSAAASSPVRTATLTALCVCAPRQQQASSPHPTQLFSAHRLHKDALHCVLAFLSLTELPSAMRSCRAWYATVRSLPLQDVSFSVRSTRQLYQLLTSSSTPLARHIVTCDVRDTYTVEDLSQFLAFMPRLLSLSHPVCRLTELLPQLYSSQLRELNVDLAPDSPLRRSAEGDLDDEDELAAQIKNLSSAAGLRSLTIALPDNVGNIEWFSLESIECMLALESLTLHNGTFLPPEQMVHIRRLPSLRTLSLDGLSELRVKALFEDRPDCPPLQLHHLDGIAELNLQIARLLIRMPTLQRVESWSTMPDALQLLAHGLPDLHTLSVRVNEATPKSGWAVVRDCLAACRQLTALTLAFTPSNELTALLLALPPSVRKLDILYCYGLLHSDAFFHCVSASGLRQLERLTVRLQRNELDRQKVAEWQARMAGVAPWINAVIEM